MKLREKSALAYILIALIPYSRPNLKLVFFPNKFFDDLEKISKYKKSTLKKTYYRAHKSNLIKIDSGKPALSKKGKTLVKIYQPTKLKNAQLMVVFDIPETKRHKRRVLRTLLRELYFEQIQKSVWVTKYDFVEYLKSEISANDLEDCVIIYEVSRL